MVTCMQIMRPVNFICFTLVLISVANAQIPRTTAGLFEYSGEFAADNTQRVMERARSFFNQPFLVHWDSIIQVQQSEATRFTGTGYITVRAKHHGLATPSPVPVSLQMIIEVKNGRYRYIINHFVVNEKEGTVHFGLENKPAVIKSIVYDQLIQNTHKKMSFVIGWLRRYMKGEE